MIHTFPQKTVLYYRGEINKSKQDCPQYSNYDWLVGTANAFSNGSAYGFTENLRTGHYVHYVDEIHDNQLADNYNCTNVIPALFIITKELGFIPQIVQFSGFRDVKTKHDHKKQKDSSPHYSLIVDVGRKHPYLMDPFYDIFGPILEQGEGHMCIGRTDHFSWKRREFDQFNYFSENEFVKMFERLREPAESLEMLIAGQKIHSSITVDKIDDCIPHIYYHDDTNAVSVRIYQPIPLISNRAMISRIHLDNEGKTLDQEVELYYASDYQWATLEGEEYLATLSIGKAKEIERRLKPFMDLNKRPRIGPMVAKDPELKSLIECIGVELMGPEFEEIENLEFATKLIIRVLYEDYRHEEGDYVLTQEERDNYLVWQRSKEIELRDQCVPLHDQLYFHNEGINKLDKKLASKLQRKINSLQNQGEPIVNDLINLKSFRRENRIQYDRLMDQFLFARALMGYDVCDSFKELTKVPLSKHLDDLESSESMGTSIITAYASMIFDFIPAILDAKRHLELDNFIDPIRGKVKARREKYFSV